MVMLPVPHAIPPSIKHGWTVHMEERQRIQSSWMLGEKLEKMRLA